MLERLKRDWKDFKAGMLIALVVILVSTVFGRGVCWVKNVIGLPCPGCGMTRSFLLILQGEFKQAWELQPFAYGWIVFAMIFFVDRYVFGKREVVWRMALILLCGGMLVFYVYRLFTGGLAGI